MKFNQLVHTLELTHNELFRHAAKAVNIGLTIRNWLFGFYIVEFEQNGEDRAQYGQKLLADLAERLAIKGLSAPELSRCRQFYHAYPQFLGLLTQKSSLVGLVGTIPDSVRSSILGVATQKSQNPENDESIIHVAKQDVQGFTENDHSDFYIKLLQCTSFTHFVELIKLDDPVKRKFYELLVLKTQPSVNEFKRQIHSLSFERLGLAGNKEISFEKLQQKITPADSNDLIKSHYVFDFLQINHAQMIEESDLEQALLDHLQDFIIELGNGFCFEARQKRILIDDEYFFIDLVFYHRILKCHVLFELKTQQAKHEHIGQLKVYLQHYKHQVMEIGDNPPVGILLVTDKKKTLVEYAIADSDKEIFVSKYQFQLPDKKDLESFINNEIEKL